jgi:hypothetical protein
MNRVVAQQELERQNFRVRGSGGDAVFRPAARWLRLSALLFSLFFVWCVCFQAMLELMTVPQ